MGWEALPIVACAMNLFDAPPRPYRPSSSPPTTWLGAVATAAAVALATLLAGCAVGPDYVRPQLDLPTAYQENTGWKPATPQLIDASQPWWEAYHDTGLSTLMAQANRANQNILQSEAVYREARAIAAAARASFFPTVGASAGASQAVAG